MRVPLRHFNSIKVRLEQISLYYRTYKNLFQFHKGAIRTARLVPVLFPPSGFQFHKGAIRTEKMLYCGAVIVISIP